MKPTTVHLHSEFQVGKVDERIFGGFLEHLGRAVYQGVYDPENTQADEDGLREDLRQVLERLKMTVMRYPGGNFASGYHWQDGVGPGESRPVMRDLAWNSLEPNKFGTDEFVKLCRKLNWDPMLTVNLGTGSPEEARNWVEYCNCPAGTRYSNLRAANGSAQPYDVKLWCLGNEMDGEWQLGHVPADQYAVRAQQAAKMMKDADGGIELVVCGSCGQTMPSYLEWDRVVLEYCGEAVDYLSTHRYARPAGDDTEDFLAITNSIDQQIEDMATVCRFAQARGRSNKRISICMDEWNVWYKDTDGNGQGKFAPHLLEEMYNLEDALVVAGFLNSFVRHADVVKIANLAQIVNVAAPVQTSDQGILVQSIFYPLEMVSRRRNGVSLRPSVCGPTYTGKTNGTVTYIDAAAVLDGQRLSVFLINRNSTEPSEVVVSLADMGIESVENGELLTGPEAKAANSWDEPALIKAVDMTEIAVSDGRARLKLPPLSFAAVTLRIG